MTRSPIHLYHDRMPAAQQLDAVRCPGSMLAALLLDAGKAATAAAAGGGGGRSEGLLLGRGKRRREEVRGDDAHEAGERVVVETDLTAFLRTTAPSSSAPSECSFYGPDGRVQGTKLARHVAVAGVAKGHGVVGWYVTRPALGATAPRPTLRELAVLQSLGEHLKEQGGGQQGQPPPVLVVVHLGLRAREATQAWSYGVYHLGPEAAAEAADGPLVPRPLLLEVRNIAHDSAAEYRAYRGGYAPALLPLSDDDSHGKGGAGAAAVGAPMPPVLAAMASRVPSPYVEEAELHFDALIARLHGLVDTIAAEETKVNALQREHQELLRRLADQQKQQQEQQPQQQQQEQRQQQEQGEEEEKADAVVLQPPAVAPPMTAATAAATADGSGAGEGGEWKAAGDATQGESLI